MKTLKQVAVRLLIWLALLKCGSALAQPALPPLPEGRILDVWSFAGTNFLSEFHYAPTSLTNVVLVPTWDGNGLQVDDTNAAWITYPVVEPSGHTNLDLGHGTVETWLSPDWNSADGLGVWGTIFEVGNWSTNLATATGAWGLFVSPDGSELLFSAQTNGVFTNYLNTPISWNAGDWHHVLITYSATNSELYLEGQFVTNGPGISVIPSVGVLSNGFSIGSDSGTGLLQSRAVYNQFITYNYQLDADTIAEDYAYDSQNVYPLPSSGRRFGMDDSGPPGFPGDGGTNGGGGGVSFYSPTYGSNDLWLEFLPLGTNIYNSNPTNLTLKVHGTASNFVYQVLSTTNLQATNTIWTLEQNLLGSSSTNFTVTTLPLGNEPEKFFKVLAYVVNINNNVTVGSSADSDGDGLPDSWESTYGLNAANADTGDTGTPDGYKMDSAGDGYSNLQKYLMGIAPNVLIAPAVANAFSEALNTNGNIAFSWQRASDLPSSGAGAVTGYTLTYNSPGRNFTTNLTASQTNFNVPLLSDDGLAGFLLFPTDTSGFWGMPTVTFRINYANTNSQIITNTSPFDPACFVNGAIVRGTGGATSLVISSPSQNLEAVRLISITGDEEYPINEYGGFIGRTDFGADLHGVSDTNFGFSFGGSFNYIDIPLSSFTNGIYHIPTSLLPVFSDLSLNILGVGKNGNLGSVVIASPQTNTWDPSFYGVIVGINNDTIPFLDGRTNIAQNISFLLRGAGAFAPFDLSLGGAYDIHGYSNYVTSGFSFVAYDRIFYGLGDPEFSDYTNTIERNEFEPFEESAFLTNILFSTSLFDAQGNFTNQVDYPVQINSLAGHFPTLSYATANSNLPPAGITAILNPTSSGNILSYDDFFYQYWVIDNNDGSVTFPSGAKNYYGLPYTAVTYFGNDQTFDVAHQGDTFYPSNDYFFQTVTAPTFSTASYYFARPRVNPVPGEALFTVTNVTPAYVITSLGQPFTLTAWAKQSVNNGYSGVYAYPQQYFDKAFLADTSGNITTNQTGTLSEYGDFFPLEPGKIFLTTKPDGATGTTSQCPVYVLKMQSDANHDGAVDFSFTGSDNTSQSRPMAWWLNSSQTVSGSGTNLDQDIWLPLGSTNANYASGQIGLIRNLENFARLWICGVPTLPTNQSYSVQVGWGEIDSGAPRLRLYWASETNGGIGYLTNVTTASQQIIDHNSPIGEISPTNSLTLPLSSFTNGLPRYFLFEAGAVGKGALTLTIAQGTNIVAQTAIWMDFHDIRDLFEEVAITNVLTSWPEMVQSNMDSGFAVQTHPTAGTGDADQMTVFVHGWRMPYNTFQTFSQDMFKRLYWQGYQGKFASVRWPTRSSDSDPGGLDYITYNRSEHVAFESGTGAALYFHDLRSRYTNYTISACAHSQGNILMMEALKELAEASNSPLDNYVLMEAAVPAHCYDTTITNLPKLTQMEDAGVHTPNTYSNYASEIRGGLRGGNICNLFNPGDFALVSGFNGTGIGSWENNQELMKPLVFFGYVYIPTNQTAYVITNQFTVGFGVTNLENRIVSDPLELMPFVARSRSKAVGGQAGVGNVVNGPEYNLEAQLGFTTATYDHSGEFNRNIQTPQVQGFYSQLLADLFQ